jgi:small subunit ribosomal protein S17
MTTDSNRKQLTGIVQPSKMDKTTVVKVSIKKPHPVYKKYVFTSKKYYAHDPGNKCKEGDKVIITESKPLSKMKRWRVSSILEKGKII